MKKIVLLCFLILTVSISAQENAEFKSQTIEFMKLTGGAEMFTSAIDQIGTMVPEAKREAYKEEAKGTLEGLYDKLAEVYMKEFTQEEVTELIAFYKSDIGKKLASKQAILTQKGMSLGQAWGMEVQQIAQKYSN